MQKNIPQAGPQISEMQKSMIIQKYVKAGDFENLERDFPGDDLSAFQITTNWALLYAIKNLRRSPDNFQGIQMLFAKGASLNAEDDSIFSYIFIKIQVLLLYF